MRCTCVVLAAGSASRFGGEKLIVPVGTHHERLIDRALRACSRFPTVIVCSPALRSHLLAHRGAIVVNDRPELGMSHSLQLANDTIDSSHAIAVVPADLALIEPRHVAALIGASRGVDVVYPRHPNGTPGHPVVFSPQARKEIPQLPRGDTIRVLRDRPGLTRLVPAVTLDWPYVDIDRESDLRRAAGS